MKVNLDQAVEILSQAQLVAIPTETVYGLAARIDQKVALERIFATKKRPFFDPLIVHIAEAKDLWPLVSNEAQNKPCFRELILMLAEFYWPGPLTLVLPKSSKVSDLITSGLDTVGIRIPNHPLTLELIRKASVPLAAPSANLFGKTSPTLAGHVEVEFPNLAVLDGGACSIGVESTILKLSVNEEAHNEDTDGEEPRSPTKKPHFNFTILRPGMLNKRELQLKISNFCNEAGASCSWIEKSTLGPDHIEAPGQVKHHYMPKKPLLLLNEMSDLDLALAKTRLHFKAAEGWVFPLSESPELAARNLYASMRELDSRQESFGIVLSWDVLLADENWEAIVDRLRRAATYAVTNL